MCAVPQTPAADQARAEWIDAFTDSMMQVSPDDPAKIRAIAEACWETAAHREPVNAVQDVLIERYLKAKDQYISGGVKPER